MSGELPFIDLNGVELANGYRTLEYLRRGLGGPKWEVPVTYPCSVLAREIGGVGPFISPAADPAPWYDAATPESAEFLGLVTKLDFQTIGVTRSVSQRFGGIGGGVIGVEQFAARGVAVDAMLIASSCAGLEYGRHWVYSKLGADCAGCALGTIRVRESCPPADGSNDPRGERIIYDAALVGGITRTDNGGAHCCDYDGIQFNLAGQSPYLYSRIGAATNLGDVSTTGGIVPPSPTVLDTFVRANTGPPPSASWTGSTRVGEGNTLRVLSNVLDDSVHTGGSAGSAHWNAATFGPDVAVTVVVPTRVNLGQFAIRARIVNPTLASATFIEARVFFGSSAGTDGVTLARTAPTSGTDFQSSGKTLRTFASGDTFMLLCRGRQITVWRKPTGADWILEAIAYDTVVPTAGNVGLVIYEQGATQTLGAFGAQTQVNGAYPHDVQSILVPSQSIGISSPILTFSAATESGIDPTMKVFDGVRIQSKPLVDGGCSITDDFSVNDLATKWWPNSGIFTITGGKLKPSATGNRQIDRSTDGQFANRVKVPGGRVEAKFTLGTTLTVGGLGAWGVKLSSVFGAFLIAANNSPLTNTFALGFDANSGSGYQDTTAFTPVASHTYRIILEVNPLSPVGTFEAKAFLIDQATPTQMACRPLYAVFSSLGANSILSLSPTLTFTPAIQVYAADLAEAYDDFFFIDNSDASAYIDVSGPAGTYIVDASRRVVEFTDRFGNPSREGSGYASSPIDTPLGWVDQCAGAPASCLQVWGDILPTGQPPPTASVAMQNRVR